MKTMTIREIAELSIEDLSALSALRAAKGAGYFHCAYELPELSFDYQFGLLLTLKEAPNGR